MASATAALRLKVVATSNSPSFTSYSCRLFLYPTLHSNKGLALSCSALSLQSGPHFRHSVAGHHDLFAREKKRKNRRNVVVASLFGVGAPEALVIGVVALLVFGPKGLAEVARNLGKTLREFQPTIRELQQVSKEFKSTLEREIGLDETASSSAASYNNSATGFTNNQSSVLDPNGKPPTAAYSSEDLLKVTEEQLATSASTATATADAPPPTTNSQVPQDAADLSKSSEVTPPDTAPVETAAVATAELSKSSEVTPPDTAPVEKAVVATSLEGISESSNEAKLSEKTTE